MRLSDVSIATSSTDAYCVEEIVPKQPRYIASTVDNTEDSLCTKDYYLFNFVDFFPRIFVPSPLLNWCIFACILYCTGEFHCNSLASVTFSLSFYIGRFVYVMLFIVCFLRVAALFCLFELFICSDALHTQ